MATLHLMVGLPCSGKTTRAKELEAETGAVRLTPDDWHRTLHGQDATHPDHDARHSSIEAIQWDLASTLLSKGVDVILDFGFWSRAERIDFKNRATQLGARSEIHYCDVPMEDLFKRLERRNSGNPEEVTLIPVSEMEKYVTQFEPPTGSECDS